MPFQRAMKRALHRYGIDLVRFTPTSHPLARRARLLSTYEIELVLDVGANTGQYGSQLRELGYQGRIISFEPLTEAYRRLCKTANSDASWSVMNIALGERDHSCDINVAGNLQSSSFCQILASHVEAAPGARTIGTEAVNIRTLDSLFNQLCAGQDHIFLKVDTQGYEKEVLNGAALSLASIDTIQLEMSLVPLYRGEMLFSAMIEHLAEKGFQLVSLEPGFSNASTGQLLQVDGVFHRFT